MRRRQPTKQKAKRPKPRTAQERTRIYGTEARNAWMRSYPCLSCGSHPVELAHVKSGGMGRKADAQWIIPLCHTHHAMQHQKGWSALGWTRDTVEHWAAVLDARWQQAEAVSRRLTPPDAEDA
jgi:hypothetical protein